MLQKPSKPTWQSARAATQGKEKASKGVVCLMHIVHHLYPKDLIFWKVLNVFYFPTLAGTWQITTLLLQHSLITNSAQERLHQPLYTANFCHLLWIVNNIIPPFAKLIWNPIPCRRCHHKAHTCTGLVLQGILHFSNCFQRKGTYIIDAVCAVSRLDT